MRCPPTFRAVGDRLGAFTLIELMVVIGIMAILVTTGVPLVYNVTHKEPMRKTLSEIQEVCMNARAQAILKGAPVDLIIHPQQRRLDVGAAAQAESQDPAASVDPGFQVPSERPAPQGPPATLPNGSGRTALIHPAVTIEMIDVNLREYKNAEIARVRFFPNGTCDEMTIILQHGAEWKKIWLEVTTGLVDIGNVK